MLKVGILGIGGICGAHVPGWNALEDAQVTAICDIRPERFDVYPELADARRYTDADEMLEREKIDVLDICLPTYLHVEHAKKALERGIHVLCEKPISLHAEDVAMLYDTAKRHNVKFMIAQVIRFFPAYAEIKKYYENKTYGELLSGHMHRLGVYPAWSWDNWYIDEARSGLVPFDLHIHDADFLVWAFGAPKRVDSNRARRPDQDYLSATYVYDDFFVTAEAAWYAADYPFQFGFRFQFERALAVYEGGVLKVYRKPDPTAPQQTKEERVVALPDVDGYAAEIRYFADCVRADKPVEMVQPESLVTVIETLHTIH